ncbi:MAG: M55 family metallopeptidase, partial [Candidatus Heimdallarchaeaceae archaeon]
IIADSHGPMVNLLIENLPEYVEIVRGNLRPTSMVAGIEGCNVALFLGYHAKYGTAKSTLDHTYSGGCVHKILVNGVEASEYILNSYIAGELGIPAILVAGDKQLMEDDVKTLTPWVEQVVLKESLSRLSAKSPSMIKIKKELKTAVNKAVIKYTESSVQPLITAKPVKINLTLKSSEQTDAVSLLPFVKRLSGLEIEYTSKDMVEAYNSFQAIVYIASAVSSSMKMMS